MMKNAEKQTESEKSAASAHLSSQGKLPPKNIVGPIKQVIATEPGYYNYYREEGAVFDVPADAKASWFRDVKGGKHIKNAEEELV